MLYKDQIFAQKKTRSITKNEEEDKLQKVQKIKDIML